MKSATSNVLSKLMDSGRIGCRLADQVRHQREVIQSLNREKTDAVERRKVLEVEVKSLTETNITLVLKLPCIGQYLWLNKYFR